MRVFDCHSHWSTKRGYIFQTEEELASQERIWGTRASFETEQEMTDSFRKNNVRAMMDLATTALSPMTIGFFCSKVRKATWPGTGVQG